MLKWTLTLAIISIFAGVLGFGGVAATTAGAAKVLFCVFLVMFVAVLLFGLLVTSASDQTRLP